MSNLLFDPLLPVLTTAGRTLDTSLPELLALYGVRNVSGHVFLRPHQSGFHISWQGGHSRSRGRSRGRRRA